MNIIENKILVMAKPESKIIIEKSLENISDITILEADSENKAFELIYKHIFILVIIDETLPNIDIFKIGTMLLSHKETYNAPLLIITDTIRHEKFLKDFQALQIDYIQKPFNGQLIFAKIKIFFELFKQKNAVDQSINELDKVYKKIIDQHELDMEKEDSKKELINHFINRSKPDAAAPSKSSGQYLSTDSYKRYFPKNEIKYYIHKNLYRKNSSDF